MSGSITAQVGYAHFTAPHLYQNAFCLLETAIKWSDKPGCLHHRARENLFRSIFCALQEYTWYYACTWKVYDAYSRAVIDSFQTCLKVKQIWQEHTYNLDALDTLHFCLLKTQLCLQQCEYEQSQKRENLFSNI